MNIAEDTLFARINKVSSLIRTKGPSSASILDIAAMKLIALIGKAKKRDYTDIFYLLEKLSLEEMFKAAKKNFFPRLSGIN